MPHKEDDEDESDHVVVVDAKDSSDAAEAISRIIESLCRMLKLCTTTARSSCGKRSLQSSRDFNREIQDKAHGRKEHFCTQWLIQNRQL